MLIKFLSEVIPPVSFFVGYFYGGSIESATLYILVSSIICISGCYLIEGEVSKSSLISVGVLLIFASITLISGNPMYIKIKPTIVYVIFGGGFFISAVRNNTLLKYMFNHFVQLEDRYWNILSYRATVFSLVMAILNEVVWRNFSESTWVLFKIFGAIPAIVVFLLLQLPFILKNKISSSLDK